MSIDHLQTLAILALCIANFAQVRFNRITMKRLNRLDGITK